MPVSYTKIFKNGEWQNIESDRLQRFLDEGWSTKEQPKTGKKSQTKGKKNKVSASAEVTPNPVVEEELPTVEPTEEELNAIPCIECDSEEHSYKDCGEDNWTYSEDDFTPKEEN